MKDAGGEVGDFKGHKNPLFSENIICSNANNYKEFQLTIEKIMLAE